jgi:hypothetical protein
LMDPEGTAADLLSRSSAVSPNGTGGPES